MTFQKPSKFHGDLTDRVESLEASQRRQDVEISKVSNIAASIRPGSVFMEWDGESMTGAALLNSIGAGVGIVLQEYNADLTSCPAGKILGRAAGGSPGPAEDITVGSGLTMSGTTVSFSPANSSIAVAKLGPINASQILGRDGAAGTGDCQAIDIGDGLQIASTTLSVPAGGLTLDRIQDLSQSRLLGRGDSGTGAPEELTLGCGVSIVSGAVQQDMLFRVLDSDATAQNVGTAQPWFPSAGTVDVPVGTYMFDGVLYLTTGTTSHSLLLKFDSGTATIGSFAYYAVAQSVLESNNAVAQSSTWTTGAGANTVLAASTTAARWVRIVGTLRVTASGTFKPEFRFSAAPGGTNTVKANSYFRLLKIGDETVTSLGTWS